MKILLIIYLVIMIILCAIVISMQIQKYLIKKNGTSYYSENIEGQNKKNRLFFLYKFYRIFPFINKFFDRVYKKVYIIYPADTVSINILATKIMTENIIKAVGLIVFTLVVSGSDIFFICAGLLTSYLIFYHGIQESIEKLDKKLLKQFSVFLNKVRHYYHKCGRVEDAVYDTLDEIGYEISLHISKIYDILVSTNMDDKIEEYIDQAPNTYVLTFVSIATAIKEHGDKILDDSSSLFLKNLQYLQQEINEEQTSRKEKEMLFKGTILSTLIPLFMIKPMEIWCKVFMPETKSFYGSPFGIGMMISIFVSLFICYTLVMELKGNQKEAEKTNSIFKKMSEFPIIDELLTKEINKHYTKYMDINDIMKITGDKTGPTAFLMKSLSSGIITFTVIVILLFSGAMTSKYTQIRNFSNSFSSTVVPNDNYLETMRKTGEQTAKQNKHISITTQNEASVKEKLSAEIQESMKLKGDSYAEEVANEVINKIEKYQNAYFKWYYLLIALISGIVAFFVPYKHLMLRKKIINMSQEDEVNQFNALALIFMNIDGITANILLEWIERFAYCFKESIQDCIVNIEFGEQQALETLRDSEPNQNFKNFVENMLSIDEIGMTAAFDEILTDRDNYLKNRELDNHALNLAKSRKAHKISAIPSVFAIVGYLCLPMALYGFSMIGEFMKNT